MLNWLKKLIITRLLIPVTQLKKLQEIFAVATQDSVKLKKKYLIIVMINLLLLKLIAGSFTTRLKQVKFSKQKWYCKSRKKYRFCWKTNKY